MSYTIKHRPYTELYYHSHAFVHLCSRTWSSLKYLYCSDISKFAMKLASNGSRDTKPYVKIFKASVDLCFKATPLPRCLQTAVSMPSDSYIRASLHHDQTTTDNNSHQPLGHRKHAAHWSFQVLFACAVANWVAVTEKKSISGVGLKRADCLTGQRVMSTARGVRVRELHCSYVSANDFTGKPSVLG